MADHRPAADAIYDLIGIGLGPFNLSLAALTAPIDELSALFIDENAGFEWHPGLILEGATLQTPFMADLVTLADPTSPYSFLNYLKTTGRIYAFYIRERFFMLREEYNQYCRWVTERLDNLCFNQRVTTIEYDAIHDCYRISAIEPTSGERTDRWAYRLVLGTGPRPYWPESCETLDGPVCHAVDYLKHRDEIDGHDRITLIGSGQSAAEIFHSRLAEAGPDQRLDWFTRSSRFFAMAYDKLTLELTSPEYIDYFHALPETTRRRLDREQKPLYKGIDRDLSDAIYDTLYEKQIHGTANVGLQANASLIAARYDLEAGEYVLDFLQIEQGVRFRHRTAALILATGFVYRTPAYLESIASHIRWDRQNRFCVGRDYAIDHARHRIFVQNAERHTHGFTASDLGMACYRNAVILARILGREIYPIERRIAFQTFDANHWACASLETENRPLDREIPIG